MQSPPPQSPPLSVDTVESIVDWLDRTSEWLRHDHAAARAHGHVISTAALANLRLYEDAALLFRESYDTLISDG